MLGRKKYRKKTAYFYFVSGIKQMSKYQSATFNSSGTLILNRNMTAVEMHSEVMFHVKKFNELSEEYGTFAVYSYHVERN